MSPRSNWLERAKLSELQAFSWFAHSHAQHRQDIGAESLQNKADHMQHLSTTHTHNPHMPRHTNYYIKKKGKVVQINAHTARAVKGCQKTNPCKRCIHPRLTIRYVEHCCCHLSQTLFKDTCDLKAKMWAMVHRLKCTYWPKPHPAIQPEQLIDQ